MEGWIKLHRQMLNSDLWLSEKFSRGQAWADLIMIASYKESSYRKRGIKVSLLRGQIGKSLDELSKRWMWSIGKVKRFLNELENENQIKVANGTVNQIITILNYDKYQSDSITNSNADSNTNNNADDNANSITDGNQIDTQTDTQTETYKKEKNNILPLTPTYTCAHEAEVDLDVCLDSLLNERVWLEQFCMNKHITPQNFAVHLKSFFAELQNRGETSKSIKDAKFHFSNWFKTNKLNETDRKLSKADKTRNIIADIANNAEESPDNLPDDKVLNFL